jgi:hypothetical protein
MNDEATFTNRVYREGYEGIEKDIELQRVGVCCRVSRDPSLCTRILLFSFIIPIITIHKQGTRHIVRKPPTPLRVVWVGCCQFRPASGAEDHGGCEYILWL